MRKLLVVSSALAIAIVFVAGPAQSAQTRAEKRGHCITEAKGVAGKYWGRTFRTQYRACMVRR
jgi:hypothetical protein